MSTRLQMLQLEQCTVHPEQMDDPPVIEQQSRQID
jgi:hypothetical protein